MKIEELVFNKIFTFISTHIFNTYIKKETCEKVKVEEKPST